MSLLTRPIEFIARVRKVGEGRVTASITIPIEITEFFRFDGTEYVRVTIEEIHKGRGKHR